ncbi:MAG: HD domain-containing protein [Chloroflexi bacterium]|nr:HD domain-containing protein [Chloroflexota bacterium]
MGGSTRYLHLRFSALSFLLACLIGALVVFASHQLVASNDHEAAATSTSRLFAGPLRTIFAEAAASDPPVLTATQRARVDELSRALIPSEIYALRVYAADGAIIYASDGAGTAIKPPSPGTSWQTVKEGETPLFVTYLNDGPYTAQLTEDAGPIDTTIASHQRSALIATFIAVSLLFLLVQGAFWLIVRGITSDHRRLVRLYVAGEQMRGSLDMHDVLTQLTRDATLTAKGTFGLVALYDHENGDMMLRCTYDHSTGTIAHHQRAVEEWFMRRCVITNTTIISGQACDAFHQFFAEVPDEGQINVVCVPMTLRDKVAGVVAVLRPPTQRRNGFAPDNVRQVVDLAAQGAMAVEQAELFAKVRAYADEVELSYDSTLKALTAALDAKDDVTEGHCERVSKLTAQLARDMGIPDRALVDIERGALLHDVGKIGVPDAVLKKPAALNELEWEAIRKHPLLAGIMISKVGFLEGATPILLYHHERFDGAGYPFGLAGDRIPLEARIFSVVDAYDAITSDRPYRTARIHDEAMREITDNAGTQFDPAVVLAFQRLMSSRPELHARLATSRAAARAQTDDDNPHLAESVA